MHSPSRAPPGPHLAEERNAGTQAPPLPRQAQRMHRIVQRPVAEAARAGQVLEQLLLLLSKRGGCNTSEPTCRSASTVTLPLLPVNASTRTPCYAFQVGQA